MPVFVISYDLNKAKDYPRLWTELKRLKCVRALDSVWVGLINGTAAQVRDHLASFVDNDDSLIVAQSDKSLIALKRPYQEAIDWVAARA